MKQRMAVGAVLMLLGLGVQSARVTAAPVPAPLTNVHRIVTLGDSITQMGEGRGGYVWLMRHYLTALYPDQAIEVVNAGISGHKSNDMLARFDRDVVQHKPDVVTISVGINDVWHGFDQGHPNGGGPNGIALDTYKANVNAMIDAAQKANIRVVLFTPTIFEDGPHSPRNTVLQSYTEAIRQIAAQRNLVLADQNLAFWDAENDWNAGRPIRLTRDQVHINPAGDVIMARTALLALGVTLEDIARANTDGLDALTRPAPAAAAH